MNSVTAWLSRPAEQTGVHVAEDNGGWSYLSYRDLARSARRVGSRLAECGVGPGDVVCLVIGAERTMLSALFGTWVAGGTICPVAPPLLRATDRYIAHLANVFAEAKPTVVATTAEYAELCETALAQADQVSTVWVVADDEADTELLVRDPGEIALLQFTSGSTDRPTGVMVTWNNLAANFAAYQSWGDGDATGGVACWLPLHHDMGLIGGMLFAVTHQDNLWLMRPDQFLRDPARWLECFGPGRARHTACPTFGLIYAARRVSPNRLASLDLSRLSSIVVGAEPVDPAVLRKFSEFASAAGFDSSSAFLPAYGLAENTLAVSMAQRGRPVPTVRIDSAALRFGQTVRIDQSAPLESCPGSIADGWLIGHGLPTADHGISVSIVDHDDTALPDGSLGEIVVGGSCVAVGYRGNPEKQAATFRDGLLYTGDAGFVHDGDLYVLGRMGDSITINGRNVYAEDLDARITEATGLPRTKLTVVCTTEAGQPTVVVFAAAAPERWADKAYQTLRRELGASPKITLVAGSSRMLQRTSSGKPRRRHMWRQFTDGAMPGRVIDAAGTTELA
ncbi:AMP-binding protein [Nocardia sp. NBC_01499]|uniref:AMP-binding protein n=1 Tax=Nocardia sp. NBC_01499 TaxID=2903597 RepID=UPI003866C577